LAFTTSGSNPTSFVGTSGADSTLIQNVDSSVFVGAQGGIDNVDFQNFKGLVNDYTVKAGAGNDLVGAAATTSFNNSFFNGNAGNDTVTLTNATSTTIYGGAGTDTVTVALMSGGLMNGNLGDDGITSNGVVSTASVYGGQGNDNIDVDNGLSSAKVRGNLGTDNISVGGSIGSSTVNGNAGNDTINTVGVLTGFAASTIFGGAGNDTISAATNTAATIGTFLSGDDGNDNITGGSGDDTILTGIGTDAVSGGAGNDSVTTGTGVDTLTVAEAGVSNVDTVTGFTLGTDLYALGAAAFAVGAGEAVFSLSDGNGADVGVTAAGGLEVLTSAAGGTENLTNGGAGGAVVDVVFLSTAGATFAAAKGAGDLTVANHAANEATLFSFYDTDDSSMVLLSVFADAGFDDINSASSFLEISRTAMAASDYTIANLTATLSVA
jgi:Ca2+-binding RTX toxin-like protein